MVKRNVVLLVSHPDGEPKMSDYKVVEEELGDLEDGLVRVETQYVSVDPYLRGKMSGVRDSYFIPFSLNEPISSLAVGKVIESKNSDYSEGDVVYGEMQWATVADLKPMQKINVDPSQALSLFGLTGLTAYVGLLIIGKLDEKEKGSTVLVSGAAGATGNVVGQIAKLKGYRVVGIAGTEEKLKWIKDDLKFDEVINYKTENIVDALNEKCPNGIDVYFDNVGGEIFDAALNKMNRFGVIINCGAISTYNAKERPQGPRVEWAMITKSLRMQGFIVMNHAEEFAAATKDIAQWIKEGKLQGKVTEYDATSGVEAIPESFIKMMSGNNIGKSIVKIR